MPVLGDLFILRLLVMGRKVSKLYDAIRQKSHFFVRGLMGGEILRKFL
jgi:hypothetical protein